MPINKGGEPAGYTQVNDCRWVAISDSGIGLQQTQTTLLVPICRREGLPTQTQVTLNGLKQHLFGQFARGDG